MSNETKVENTVTPKGVTVSADKLFSVVLERSISDKDQTIGAQKSNIDNLRGQIEELRNKLKAVENVAPPIADDQKVAVISSTNSNCKICPECGYENNSTRGYCYDCGYNLKNIKKGNEVIEYRNLDTVIANIRAEESKKLKLDNTNLEAELDDTKFKLTKANNALTKMNKDHGQELTDIKRDIREKHQKELEGNRRKFNEVNEINESKIDELVEEIQKLEENKTDAVVEEQRKQEIIDLKSHVTELENLVEEAKKASTGRMKRFWQKYADRSDQRKVEEEIESKKERIDQISNQYPKTKVKDAWWKKGKYAKNEVKAEGGLWSAIMGSSNPYGW